MGAGIFSSHSHRPRYRSSSNYCGFTIASKAKSSGTCRRQHSGSRRGRGNCVKLYWSGTTPKTDSSQNAKGLISAGKTEIFTEDESGVTCESWLSDQMNARVGAFSHPFFSSLRISSALRVPRTHIARRKALNLAMNCSADRPSTRELILLY
eukprot:1355362-Amorphochlora_amoeboformis.AAC.1